ncbi:MAG: TPM domain-containing protein [Bacteroidetes bacterium]|nr:TPM domain-containing protein [Bacteroidota bacterium]
MANAKNFFTKEQTNKIVEAIANAELDTSGEIRVHLEEYCDENVVAYSMRLFTSLKMHETEKRNGVLFYLAVKDKRFAIIGDDGIDKAVPPDFWESIKNHMLEKFKKNEFTEGLCEGIAMAGEKLKLYFPYHAEDKNELKNDISFN